MPHFPENQPTVFLRKDCGRCRYIVYNCSFSVEIMHFSRIIFANMKK